LGLADSKILTGPEIAQISEQALVNRVAAINLFAEVEPNQKERIILALKKAGFVVGYMGDGINDVSALHAADVGISVDSAADVAKDTAQIVLLEKNLQVLVAGVKEGRITCLWRPALTLAICSAWRVLPYSCRFYRCCPSRFC
jgi:Mg2+-importing ATPase